MANSNLAYKYDPVLYQKTPNNRSSYNTSYRQNNKKPSTASAHREQNTSKAAASVNPIISYKKGNKEMLHRKITFLRIVYVLTIAASAAFMISKFVAVNETAGEIRKLNSQLDSMRAYTSQRIFEMEQKIDLSEVEHIATTRLGMQRPESYQMVYVNVDKEDVSELTANDVEGAGNSVKSFMSNLKKNIIEFFSIN